MQFLMGGRCWVEHISRGVQVTVGDRESVRLWECFHLFLNSLVEASAFVAIFNTAGETAARLPHICCMS